MEVTSGQGSQRLDFRSRLVNTKYISSINFTILRYIMLDVRY